MSTGRSNALDALPRASFLTYFQTPSQPKRRTSDDNQKGRPSCKAPCSQAAPLSRILEDTTAEEDTDKESILGDCKHSDHCESDEQSEHESSWSKMLSFTGYTLLVLLIMLNLDFLLSAYNVNAGVVKWDSRRTIAGSSSREMHFCLAEQNRFAPTSRVWRYVPRESSSGWTTRVMNIHADPTEEHKLFTEDIIAGEAMVRQTCDFSRDKSKPGPFLSGKALEGGDDLALEGILSREV